MVAKNYRKNQLAEAYGVDTRTLMRWIERNPKCKSDLSSAGYYRHQKEFTVRQVEIIFDYLGQPSKE